MKLLLMLLPQHTKLSIPGCYHLSRREDSRKWTVSLGPEVETWRHNTEETTEFGGYDR